MAINDDISEGGAHADFRQFFDGRRDGQRFGGRQDRRTDQGHDDGGLPQADVIDESARQPVLVDFWAPWCGPCKQLTPVIEKVVKAAGGKVRLVKMNIDEHPEIAGQLGIQSIPAVIAFQRASRSMASWARCPKARSRPSSSASSARSAPRRR
jgi:thioredoxin